MKILIVTLAALCFSGVTALPYTQDSMAQHSEENAGLTNSELKQVWERLPCLRPGMTLKEVFDTLGVDLRKRAYAQWGSGPTGDYRWVYQLAPVTNENGYNLVVVSDEQAKFKRAKIVCWSGSKKCGDDTKEAEDKGCPGEAKESKP